MAGCRLSAVVSRNILTFECMSQPIQWPPSNFFRTCQTNDAWMGMPGLWFNWTGWKEPGATVLLQINLHTSNNGIIEKGNNLFSCCQLYLKTYEKFRKRLPECLFNQFKLPSHALHFLTSYLTTRYPCLPHIWNIYHTYPLIHTSICTHVS